MVEMRQEVADLEHPPHDRLGADLQEDCVPSLASRPLSFREVVRGSLERGTSPDDQGPPERLAHNRCVTLMVRQWWAGTKQ
jgi:hypothetical protein